MISWQEICENPRLQDLPFKIETNRFDQIIMSPSYLWHGDFQAEIVSILKNLMQGGRVLVECAVETSDGTKVPDVAWISSGRYAPHRRKFTLPIAPEICIGVISAGNTRAEMAGKRALYFDLDAREVWFCDDAGRLTFFVRGSSRPLRKSRLCPSFPARIGCD